LFFVYFREKYKFIPIKTKRNSLNASLITYKLSDESDWGTMHIYTPVDFRP